MVKRIIISVLKMKKYILLVIFSIAITIYFFMQNKYADSVGFLLAGNAVFLIFNALFFLRMFYRYSVYRGNKSASLIRAGRTKYWKCLFSAELFFQLIYLILLFTAGWILLKTSYPSLYIRMAGVYILLNILLVEIRHEFMKTNHWIIGPILSYLLLAIYNYYILGFIK